MPAIARTVRSCALSLVSLGVIGAALTAAPAHAAPNNDRSGAVALDDSHLAKYDARVAKARKHAERRLDSRVRSAADIAMNQRGDAYSYGSVGPNAFDCSGLIFYSYRRAGFDVPRTSGAQAGATRRIAKADMRPGDLMFFFDGGGVYHSSVFLRWDHGNALMVHAPGSGQRVTVATPWTGSWFAGTLRR